MAPPLARPTKTASPADPFPPSAWFPVKELAVMVADARFQIAPPSPKDPVPPIVWLPLKWQLQILSIPPLRFVIAPPPNEPPPAKLPSALLPAKTSLLRVRVLPTLKIPPPPSRVDPPARPWLIVRPAMVTETGCWLWLMLKTRAT